jgi:hypothetical protein
MGTRVLKTVVTVVIGTHEQTPVPREVRTLGLLERIAVIQHTFRPDKGFMYVDSDIALKVLTGLEQLFGVKPRVLHGNKILDTGALAALYYSKANEEERDPFERAEFYLDDTLVCLVVTENWAAVGGPRLYHDSVTYSVYSQEDISKKFLAGLADLGVTPDTLCHTKRLADGRLESAN